MERCTMCIWPLNLPTIKLNENNICNYCQSFLSLKKKYTQKLSKEKLINYLHKKKGSTKSKYDCLIGLSGGKDSTYVLYLAVKELNLNVLTYTYDNSFRSEDANKNVENTLNILGCDHIWVKPDPQLIYSLMNIFIRNTGEFCTPCLMGIDIAGEKIAQNYDIKISLGGSSWRIDVGVDGMSISTYYDRIYFNNVIKHKISKKHLKEFYGSSYLLKGVKKIWGAHADIINIYDYYEIDINSINATLKKELKWVKPCGELQHGDCVLDKLKDYLQFRKWGCSELTGYYSSLVRNGEISREDAIEKSINEERKEEPEILSTFLNKLDLSYEDYLDAINNKHFTDVKNIKNSKFFLYSKSFVNNINELRRK
ncbi:hypothetical protein ACFL5H_03555 [Candidatus Latescibacterota bacterium]